MKYLKIFELLADYEAYKSSSDYVTPNVSYVESEHGMLYDPFVPSLNINNYCTFVALEDGFSAGLYNANYEGTLEYCIDENEEWTVLEANTDTVAVNAGQTISFKGNLVNLNTEEGIGEFVTTKNFNAVGNVMSLLFGDNAATSYSLEGYNNIFKYLFSYDGLGNKNLISVSKNFLPATALADFCYFYMFRSCSNLTTAPELPATTLCEGCYDQMFRSCSNLTTVPELPATTLADFCYTGMFSGCSSLTTAPELPATTLASYCYSGMFSGCTSLTTAPELPATTLAYHCYPEMFQGCTNLTQAPAVLPATTLTDYCYTGMFSGCSSLTTAPEICSTDLIYNMGEGCCESMFSGCSKLNYIKAHFNGDQNTNYSELFTPLHDWLDGVSPSGKFAKYTSTKFVRGINGIPEGWTITDMNGQIIEEPEEPKPGINLNDLFGDYTESFNDTSYYGYPAKGTLTIAESDNAEYDLKMSFFGGKPCAVTTYGVLSDDGTQITTVQTSCNMGKFYPSTFNISIVGNNVTISGQPKFDYPTTVPDYVATKN